MKTSVSIPDELWRAAERRAEEIAGVDPHSASAVIQAALRAWIAQGERHECETPAELVELKQQAAAQLGGQAREHYRRGFRAGLLIGEIAEWQVVEDLATRYRFDVGSWARAWRQTMMDEEQSPSLARAEDAGFLTAHAPNDDQRTARLLLFTDAGATAEAIQASRARWRTVAWPTRAALISALGHPGFADYAPSTPYLYGVEQALRDLWNEALRTEPLIEPAPTNHHQQRGE